MSLTIVILYTICLQSESLNFITQFIHDYSSNTFFKRIYVRKHYAYWTPLRNDKFKLQMF